LTSRFKEPSPGLLGLDIDVNDYEQISHRSGLLHGDLHDSLNIADLVMEGADDLNLLYIRDNVPGITEMFYILPETFIRLLLVCL
jgi:hypothetical protein